jgi:hypothetical protein
MERSRRDAEWRYEPLDPARFAVGDGPFRARGHAYVQALRYVDAKVPGGRAAFRAKLGHADPFAPYYDEIFLVTADYDVSPLLHLYIVVADLEGTHVDRFIEARARWSGAADTRGMWKLALRGPSPERVAERMRFAFNRYFPPCEGHSVAVEPGRFEGRLARVPAQMSGLYKDATLGFFAGALGEAGARDVRPFAEHPTPCGLHAGVPIVEVRFAVAWGS